MVFNLTEIQLVTITAISITFLPILYFGLIRIRRYHAEYACILPLFSALFFVCIDFEGNLNSGGNIRYIGTVITLFVIIVLKGSASISKFSYIMKIAAYPLVTIAVVGSLYGRIYLEEQLGALPLAIPMLILFTRFPMFDSRVSIKKSAKLIIFLCMVLTAESSLVRLHVLPKSALLVFSHEKTFCMVLGLLLSIAVRSKRLTFIQSGLMINCFALYPAATIPLGITIGLLTFKYYKNLIKPIRLITVQLIFIGVIIISIFSAQYLLEKSSSYFDVVGKSNNTSYRLSLVNAALTEIKARPIFGTLFKGQAIVRAHVQDNRNYQLPVHNDYITFVLCGGLVCLALFLIVLIVLTFKILGTYPQFSDLDSRVLLALMGSICSLLASSLVNPILINPVNSTIFYTIVMTMIALTLSSKKMPEKKDVQN